LADADGSDKKLAASASIWSSEIPPSASAGITPLVAKSFLILNTQQTIFKTKDMESNDDLRNSFV
jgi:hypothetical protein